MKLTRGMYVPPLRAAVRRRRRLTWLQALALIAGVTGFVVTGGALIVTRTDPAQFTDLGTGLWWAVTTVTTVGYGDLVPVSAAGRVVGTILMFVGIGSIAFLTAVAASAIVVEEVSKGEREIETEEREIERVQGVIVDQLNALEVQLANVVRRFEQTSLERTLYRKKRDQRLRAVKRKKTGRSG